MFAFSFSVALFQLGVEELGGEGGEGGMSDGQQSRYRGRSGGGEAPKGEGVLTFGQGATSLPPRLYVPAKILWQDIYAVSPFLSQTNIMWLTVGLIHDASFASSIVFGNGPITFRNDAAVNITILLCIISKMWYLPSLPYLGYYSSSPHPSSSSHGYWAFLSLTSSNGPWLLMLMQTLILPDLWWKWKIFFKNGNTFNGNSIERVVQEQMHTNQFVSFDFDETDVIWRQRSGRRCNCPALQCCLLRQYLNMNNEN